MNWENRRGRVARRPAGRALLAVLSWGYGAAVVLRRVLYQWGLLPQKKLAAKVVCIGNLTTGGTGKTPAVLLAAQTLRKRNHHVAIISRGYGRTKKDAEVAILYDDEPPAWTECGDEPWMMHHALHGQNVPILVCADRAKAGQEAVTFYHSRVIILDDGFQHLKLKRDLDILLVNAADPFGGDRLLPLGNLREPVSGLRRAGLVVLTHVDRVSEEVLEALRSRIQKVNPRAHILESVHRPDFLLDVRSEKRLPLAHLKGRKAVSLCGIADPTQFEEMLTQNDVTLVQRWRYPDHHPYRLRELKALSRLGPELPIVTTFKDFTRLPKGWQEVLPGELYVLAIKLDIVKGRNHWIDSLIQLAS